jgi:hypothetical protein
MNIHELPLLFPSMLSGETPIGVLADACDDCNDPRLDKVAEELRAAEVGSETTTDKETVKGWLRTITRITWRFKFKSMRSGGHDTRERAVRGLRDTAIKLIHDAMPSFDTLPAFYNDVLDGSIHVSVFADEVEKVGLTKTAGWLRRLRQREGRMPVGAFGLGGEVSVLIELQNGDEWHDGWDVLEMWPKSLAKQMCCGHDPLGHVAVREVKRVIAETNARVEQVMAGA